MDSIALKSKPKKSDRTRAHILDVASTCVHELGFAKTTTIEIARRSGLSRGAILHHYPDRLSFFSALASHIYDLRLRDMMALLAHVPQDPAHRNQLFRASWEWMSSPSYYMWLELMVAARTDDALKAIMSEKADCYKQAIVQKRHERFGDESRNIPVSLAVRFLFFYMGGMATEYITDDSVPVETMISMFETIDAKMDGGK